MLMNIGILALGGILLVRGADQLVARATAMAMRAGLSAVFIGATVVALGTSLPEWIVSMFAVFQGAEGLSAGNIYGSNLANVALVLGLTALIGPVGTPTLVGVVARWELPWAVAAALVCALLGFWGELNPITGVVLLIAQFVFVVFGLKLAKDQPGNLVEAQIDDGDALDEGSEAEENNHQPSLQSSVVGLTIAIGLLLAGADLFISGASDIARGLGVPEWLVGLTVVSIGTSLPELVTSVVAALQGESDVALGNVLGSNIWNTFFILGSVGTVGAMEIPRYLMVDGFIIAGATVLAAVLALTQAKLLRIPLGILALGIYVAATIRWVTILG